MKDYQSLVADQQDSSYSTSNIETSWSQVDRSKSLLNQEQIQRLLDVIDDEFEVHGRGNFPTLKVRLSRFIRILDQRVQAKNLFIKRAKMNGGAASYVLLASAASAGSSTNIYNNNNNNGDKVQIVSNDEKNNNHLGNCHFSSSNNISSNNTAYLSSRSSSNDQSFGDVDLIFDVDLVPPTNFDTFKQCALETLIEFLPEDANRSRITDAVMQDAYVKKMVKIGGYQNSQNNRNRKNDVNNNGAFCKDSKAQCDLWSLITLHNDQGRCIELKFVDRIKRQFEFSVDSFQIHLDWLLYLEDNFDDKINVRQFLNQTGRLNNLKVVAESVYGDFQIALKHLNEKLIDTVEPELIRGGGLLKYVHLLIKGYRPATQDEPDRVSKMERYMCSRFFIDFGRLDQQERKLRAYLDDHLRSYPLRAKLDFMRLLYDVVDSNTVCLMNHERRASLELISRLGAELHGALNSAANQKFFYMPNVQSSPVLTTSPPNFQIFTTTRNAPILIEDNRPCNGNYLIEDFAASIQHHQRHGFLTAQPPPALYFMPQQNTNAAFFVPVV